MVEKKKLIGFFSSDASPLYKADVFRALALPEKYVIQFRYKEKYVFPALQGKYEELKGKMGCIFLVTGNDQSLDPDKRPIQHFSIRNVTVKDCRHDADNTGYAFFYLELGKFANNRILTDDVAKLPQSNVFVSDLEVESQAQVSWADRVNAVAHAFPKQLFFKINSISKQGTKKDPEYFPYKYSTAYELDDESHFELEMQFQDHDGGKSVLCTQNESEAFEIDISKKYQVGAFGDSKIFGVQTNSLARRREAAKLQFAQEGNEQDYYVDLDLSIVRRARKAYYFGLLTGLAALGIAGGQIVTKKTEDLPTFTWYVFLIGLVSLAAICAAAGFLYDLFNKK